MPGTCTKVTSKQAHIFRVTCSLVTLVHMPGIEYTDFLTSYVCVVTKSQSAKMVQVFDVW